MISYDIARLKEETRELIKNYHVSSRDYEEKGIYLNAIEDIITEDGKSYKKTRGLKDAKLYYFGNIIKDINMQSDIAIVNYFEEKGELTICLVKTKKIYDIITKESQEVLGKLACLQFKR